MLRFVLAQLRGRPRRTLALLAGMLVATTGFTVLSAGAAVQQLRVEGTVEDNFRPAYDILVRPQDSRTELEDEHGLVRPNYLSGLYGGITLTQLDQVRRTSHVELAAPVAMLGYTSVYLEQEVDLTDQVDRTADRQVFRLTPSWIADRGLTVLDDAPQYVYLTRNELVPGMPEPGTYKDGTRMTEQLTGCATNLEVEPDGTRQQLCVWPYPNPSQDGTTSLERTQLTVRQLGADGRFRTPAQFSTPEPTDRLVVPVVWRVMVLVAAVDPAAEAELVGLDQAVVDGRYLSAADQVEERVEEELASAPVQMAYPGVPALVASTPYVDERLSVSIDRLGAEQAAALPGRTWSDWVPRLDAMAGTPAGTVESADSPRFGIDQPASLGLVYESGPISYRTDAAGRLQPAEVPPDPGTWLVDEEEADSWVDQPPRFALADGFRSVTQVGGTTEGRAPQVAPVGTFDPARLRGFSPLSQVPLETYQAPEATGADDASRALLGDEPLRPNSNPAGYLSTPPLILTNLGALDHVTPKDDRPDPISAIRVRVAGVTGVDERSQELVRTVAERIALDTGLDVDITVGSSPAPRTVVLPAGDGGRPELVLTEGWSRKGAAVAIVHAADRKSVLLFGLILVVCALFLGNAVTAAVRDRRRELAVLACLGWPARRLAGVVCVEVTLVGLVAGTLAGGIALAVSGVVGVSMSVGHAALAVPVGLGVALLASAPPALAAARARPGGAVRPAVLTVRRARRRRGVLGLALANLWRVPGRTALGVVALAVGVGALTALVMIAVAFRNDVIGSLLGDEVAVRVRSVDVAAAVTAIALGVLIVADVLYINVRERAAELAALWAAGWSHGALLRLVGYEGLGIGVLGGVVGSGVGLLAVTGFAGRLTSGMGLLALGVAAGAVVVAALAAIVPALVLRRLPLSTLLAEE